MDPPRLLFVHKSSSSKSFSHSSKQEAQEINRHVQLGRSHKHYKHLALNRWRRPFLLRSNIASLSSQVESSHSIPRGVPEIPGSFGGGCTTQRTCEQHLRPAKQGHSTENQRIVPPTTKNFAPSSQLPSETSFKLIQYDPERPAPENPPAVRSNAVQYQWKRSKKVRPRGRKSKVPKTPDLSSQQDSRTRG